MRAAEWVTRALGYAVCVLMFGAVFCALALLLEP
jgi:hypothetical protein